MLLDSLLVVMNKKQAKIEETQAYFDNVNANNGRRTSATEAIKANNNTKRKTPQKKANLDKRKQPPTRNKQTMTEEKCTLNKETQQATKQRTQKMREREERGEREEREEKEREREDREDREGGEREKTRTRTHAHIVAINGFILARVALSDVGCYATTIAKLKP